MSGWIDAVNFLFERLDRLNDTLDRIAAALDRLAPPAEPEKK